MNIYIMRHGYAENGSPDNERRLTNQGKEKLKKNLPLLRSHVNSFDYVVTSPLVRAKQTAEFIHKEMCVKNELIIDQSLQPGTSITDILIMINALNPESVLIVGHMPDVSYLTLNLINSEIFELPFSPGSIAGIKIDEELQTGTGELKFMLPME